MAWIWRWRTQDWWLCPITIYRRQRKAAEKTAVCTDIGAERADTTTYCASDHVGTGFGFQAPNPSTLAIEDHKPDRLSLASLTNLISLSLFTSLAHFKFLIKIASLFIESSLLEGNFFKIIFFIYWRIQIFKNINKYFFNLIKRCLKYKKHNSNRPVAFTW